MTQDSGHDDRGLYSQAYDIDAYGIDASSVQAEQFRRLYVILRCPETPQWTGKMEQNGHG
jgi:hypothetical protein